MEANSPSPFTLAFLYTDVEQSSPLWDKRPDEMRLAMQFHDRLCDEVVRRQSGRLFRKTGDGICASFPTVNEAVHAGLQIQTALQSPPGEIVLRVRMGIHVGPVTEEGGEYAGEPMNRVARIMALAQGGQVLLSGAAQAQLSPSHHEELAFRELGRHTLRGLSAEETLYQLLHPSLSSEPPSSLAAQPNGRLPAPMNSFVGRAEAIARLVDLVEENRLVTLVGTGGIGKTRLAVEAGSRCASGFAGGAWFIDLQNVADPEKVMSTAAADLGIRETAGHGLVDEVGRRLGARRTLLIVDNCEQVLAAAAEAVRAILAVAPGAHILATSREVLGLQGERVVQVSPLSVPSGDPALLSDSRSAGETEAVRLFVDRALYANPGFQVTQENLGLLCRLTQRLDGIPLAIELAAARMRGMSLGQLVQRLDDLFAVLKSSYRDQIPRQQTLLATMDWSYRLLTAKEKRLFARLGVFAGSWSVDVCEEVAGVKPLRPDDTLDLLAGLVDKSLVMAEEKDGEMRYRLLETLRAFARSKLAEAKDAGAIHERFFDSMRSLATRLDAGILGHHQLRWRRVFDHEIDNFRSALEWGLSAPNRIEEATELVCHLSRTWLMNGDFSEASSYFERSLRLLPDSSFELRARVEILYGPIRLRAGDPGGLDMMRHAVMLAERSERRVYVECLGKFAAALFERGEFDESERLFRQMLHLTSIPPALPEGHLRLGLGAIAVERGQYETAKEQYRMMLTDRRMNGDRRGEGLALCYLAHVEALEGRPEAAEFYRSAISLFAEVPDYYTLSAHLAAASSILVEASPEGAAQVQGFADQLAERVGAVIDRHVFLIATEARKACRERLGPDQYREWYEEAKFLDLSAVLDLMGCRPAPARSAPAFTNAVL